MINDSFSSQDEDFRCKSPTPPLNQTLDNSISNNEDDFVCVNAVTPPLLSQDVQNKIMSHNKEMLDESFSSQNEDFKCSKRTPSPVNDFPSLSRSCSNTDNNPKALGSCKAKIDDCTTKDMETKNIFEEKVESESQKEKTEEVSEGEQQKVDQKEEQKVNQKEKQKEEEKEDILASQEEETNSDKEDDKKDNMVANEKVLLKYSKKDLNEVRKSKTYEEWKSYLWTNHGADWNIGDMPFELDPELRCAYWKQLSILRGREDAGRQWYASTRSKPPPPSDKKTKNALNAPTEQQQQSQKLEKGEEEEKEEKFFESQKLLHPQTPPLLPASSAVASSHDALLRSERVFYNYLAHINKAIEELNIL